MEPMKLRSFIFSSETLNLQYRVPAGALLALLFVVLANAWALKAQKDGLLYTSVPRQMIEESVGELVATNGTWWLGNSTMVASIDKEVVDQTTGEDNAYAELGSATLDVQIRLAATALARMKSGPERVILFVTKDDLNAGGSRASASSSYMQAFDAPGLYEVLASYFPLYSCRYAVVGMLRRGMAGLLAGDTKQQPPQVSQPGKKEEHYRHLEDDIDTTYLHNLGRNFRKVEIILDELSRQAKRTGARVVLVAPPVTRAIAAWQQRYAPEYPWERLLGELADSAASAGMELRDYSNLLESTTEYFRDTYHLNSMGALQFTRYLLKDFGYKTGVAHAADSQADMRFLRPR